MTKTLKWLAISTNLLLLSIAGMMLAQKGLPRSDEALLVCFLIAAPVLTLAFFASDRRSCAGSSAGVLGELVELEIEARKAVLKRRIDGDDAKTDRSAR
ncbi:MAG: hypothetical protein ACK4PN_02900 [Allorhizobium sp.]